MDFRKLWEDYSWVIIGIILTWFIGVAIDVYLTTGNILQSCIYVSEVSILVWLGMATLIYIITTISNKENKEVTK